MTLPQRVAHLVKHGMAFLHPCVYGELNAKGALALSTARQGTCFLPILYPLAAAFGAVGIACVQAIADVLSMILAVPIMRGMNKRIDAAEKNGGAE